MTNPVEILNGALEGRYLVEREIGSGGMATVYLAEDIRHKRKVAVKVLRPELASILGANRFLREVEIAAQLQHPHILTLIDSGAADGILYYVMPFIEGESLRGKLEREKELPVGDAVRIVREIVDALVKAHATGVVHRDIKPDNILLSGRHAIVTDFGIAKALSEATGGRNVTETGMALGTPTYMAPEQAVADPNVDHRADIYAVGVLAYEMLTGTPPFGGANVQAVLSAHVTQTPKAVTETRPTVPAQLGALVMKCLEKKPADRWQTAEELHAELERYATPSEGTVPVEPASKKRPVLKALAEAGVIIAVALAGVFFFNRSDENATVIQSGDRLAVIPFAPTSEDSSLSRLGRDLVVLLTRNLDGVGDIEVVDHTTVLAKTGDENRRYSLAEAAEMGRDLGAATILHGSLVRVSDQVVLDVGLFETDGLAELARVSTQAPLDDHFFLTDETTWALLEAIWRTGEAPTPSVGAITTRSWPALRAFLDGEDAIAKGEWTKAVGLYSEAIEADTLFWMAHLRHRIASGWTFGEDPTTAFAKPLSVIQQHLPPRERLQVEA
ncbi:MAG: serine/threonine-protein kinase, partial [Gemmatimonadota bacterium]|nr:serine/threonine-protein kinase [Gemmatimonadota bacterium]